jgi:hypothetical protein
MCIIVCKDPRHKFSKVNALEYLVCPTLVCPTLVCPTLVCPTKYSAKTQTWDFFGL